MPKFSISPNPPPTETRLDLVLKWVLTPLIAWLTLDFSVEYFTGLWGQQHLYRIWGAGIAITGLEVYLFRTAVLAEKWRIRIPAAILGVFIGGVSVLGSLGAFEQGVANNTLQSDGYTSNKASIETLQKTNAALLENITAATYLITNKRIAENEAKINELRAANGELERSGTAGSGNALFASLGGIFKADVKETARNVNGYTSLVFELALIFLTLFTAWRDRQRLQVDAPSQKSGNDTDKPVSDDGKPVKTPRKKPQRFTVKPDDEYMKLTPAKITAIINDCLTMRHKDGQHKGAPMYTEVGKKHGVKRQTAYRVFKEYYLNKKHQTNGHYQPENVV